MRNVDAGEVRATGADHSVTSLEFEKSFEWLQQNVCRQIVPDNCHAVVITGAVADVNVKKRDW